MTNQTTCPKCGHERLPSEEAMEGQCPSCGIFYAKFLAAKKKAPHVKPRQKKVEKRQATPKIESRPSSALYEQIKASALTNKKYIIMGVIAVIYVYGCMPGWVLIYEANLFVGLLALSVSLTLIPLFIILWFIWMKLSLGEIAHLRNRQKELQKTLRESGIDADLMVTFSNGVFFCDPKSKLIFISRNPSALEDFVPYKFDFGQIIQSTILKDGEEVGLTKTGSIVGRAGQGGLVSGVVGELFGGAPHQQVQLTQVTSLKLNLLIDSEEFPEIDLDFIDLSVPMDITSTPVQAMLNEIEFLQSLLELISEGQEIPQTTDREKLRSLIKIARINMQKEANSQS